MTEAEIGTYRSRLLPLKERLGSTGSGARPGASDPTASECEFAIALLGSEAQLLTELTDALVRIEQGTFGSCERCGRQVFRARLLLFPYTRYCFCCASDPGRRSRVRTTEGSVP